MTRSLNATYRLQLHADFTFADAAQVVPYLARLGVSHLYLSPILTAVPGSMHGYDVVDHSRVSDALGGRSGFETLVAAARAHDLGIVVDVVPNHMAFVAPENLNRQVWDVLRHGRDSDFADWFDIDWKAGGGRLVLPVLGESLAETLATGDLVRDSLDGEPVLRYFSHVWPIALGTETIEDLEELLERQHYRLASWRNKDALNYRRFFEVDGLIAVRVELPEVFEQTHRLLLALHHDGLIDGFRIDHPDGLADPTEYLHRLSAACAKGTPIWVEKILEGQERLPRNWECAGTTGYDAMQAVQASLIDPTTSELIAAEWVASQGNPSFAGVVDDAKRQVVELSLQPEVERLTRRAREALPDLDPARLHAAIVELLVAGEVYRAYVREGKQLSATTRSRIAEAFAGAISARPDLRPELEALIPLAVLAGDEEAASDFGVRLQQTWGPVMAKGIEDTTFYRWHPMIALNEVGADPTVLPTASADALHSWSVWNQEHWPQTMTTLSTHDTKRSEDARARLIAIAGDPESWTRLSSVARAEGEGAGVDLPTAHFVWQTLVAVGDIGSDRLTEYLQKALREAKLHTSWVDGDAQYEQRVIEFACAAAQSGPLHDAVRDAVAANIDAIRAVTLSAKLLQLTMPGVPDVYQGCELVDLSLVDPDNRRPVDYAAREELLNRADVPTSLDAEKLLVVRQALAVRERAHPALGADSEYAAVVGDSDHVLGFTRTARPGLIAGAIGLGRHDAIATLVTRAPARLRQTGGWSDQTIELPAGSWIDALTGTEYDFETPLRCADIFAKFPVALLERQA